MLERAPAFLQLHGGEHGHCCYAGDGDGEEGEGTGMVLLGLCYGKYELRVCRVDVHGDREDLTCCFCGVGGDYPVCFEGYACCEACEEGGRMEHGVEGVRYRWVKVMRWIFKSGELLLSNWDQCCLLL